MNPEHPVLKVNALEASADTDEIELRSLIKFLNNAHRLAFLAYLGVGGSNAVEHLTFPGFSAITNLKAIDVSGYSVGKHIIISDTDVSYIYRLHDPGFGRPENPPAIVQPDVPVGNLEWKLVHAFGLIEGSVKLFGEKIDMMDGFIQGIQSLQFYNEDRRRTGLRDFVQFEHLVTEYVDPIWGLDIIPTVALQPPIVVQFHHSAEGLRTFKLIDGNNAHNPPAVVRPADYDLGNQKVWINLA